MLEVNNCRGGGGVSESLRNYQGGVQPNLTVPYRGGEGGQKSAKNALRNL